MAELLWQPSKERAAATQMAAFVERARAETGLALPDARAVHAWSIDDRAAFWRLVWSACGVRGEMGDTALVDGERMPGARWFPGARLNFAENLLGAADNTIAIIATDEAGHRSECTAAELRAAVARTAAGLREAGVVPGDRVAAVLPNGIAAVTAMLAATSLGAMWSSCSPDFGVAGVVDRFGQIDPKVLFCVDGYRYGGKVFETRDRVGAILVALPGVLRCVVVSGGGAVRLPPDPRAVAWDSFGSDAPLHFERLRFDHPVYILFSSGTTGKPKCIVHGAGGTLLQHLKEQRLHTDLRPGERLFYFTTCGWMMWNWLVSGLASEATLVLFDGSPTHPRAEAMFDLVEREHIDVFGTSARFIDASSKAGLEPVRTHDLGALRAILSTGSPLAPESFDYVYTSVKSDVHLASISGGTDIVSCFVGGDPTLPVYRGEIQARGLGMAVSVFDAEGRPTVGEPGELVCTRAFPSMPIGFWNDPDGSRYRAAYFERFPGVWCHGDWTRETARGGFVITGRSDAVLNPGGVRIGTAEIYRQVERLDEVVESIAVGQEHGGDVRVVLFVVLRPGIALNDDLRARIRRAIRENASPRHVPAVIADVPDIPRTRSGKITELAVREVIHDRPVKNADALANPEALEHFRARPELGP